MRMEDVECDECGHVQTEDVADADVFLCEECGVLIYGKEL